MRLTKFTESSVLVLREKHEPVYMLVTTERQLFEAALTIVGARLRYGWYHEFPGQEARQIVDEADGRKAWRFLVSRSGCEYEGLSLEPFCDLVKYNGTL
jgi:hypothetical protein